MFTEGREELGGKKERQEGRQEEGVTLILRQLQRRCGELAAPMQEQIARLRLPQLEALGEALLDFRRASRSGTVVGDARADVSEESYGFVPHAHLIFFDFTFRAVA